MSTQCVDNLFVGKHVCKFEHVAEVLFAKTDAERVQRIPWTVETPVEAVQSRNVAGAFGAGDLSKREKYHKS